MSRAFTRASTEYLEISAVPVLGAPLTLACWFRSESATQDQNLIFVGDSGTGTNYFALEASGNVVGDPIKAITRAGEGSIQAVTTSGFSAYTWHFVAGVYASATDRRAMIDYGNWGTDANNRVPAGLDKTSIGRKSDSSPGDYMSGLIAEPVIYNCALTESELLLMASGCPFVFIRPQNIVAGWSLLDNDYEWMRRFDLVPFNTPGIGHHPPRVLEYWNRVRMRAVTRQGIARMIGRNAPNVWQAQVDATKRLFVTHA